MRTNVKEVFTALLYTKIVARIAVSGKTVPGLVVGMKQLHTGTCSDNVANGNSGWARGNYIGGERWEYNGESVIRTVPR